MNKKCLMMPGLLTTLLLAGCLPSADGVAPSRVDGAENAGKTHYQANVRRTAFGIPHIEARDFASMGYAYGYVQAEDNLCLLAEDTLTIRGLRSRYLGPEGRYTIPSNGATTSNRNADFFWRSLATEQAVMPLRANSDPEVLQASQGYVDGFNQYVAEIRAGEHPGRHQACRDEAWLMPIEEKDMYRRYFRLAVLASSSVFVEGIANAAPPLPGAEPAHPGVDEVLSQLQAATGGDTDSLPFPLGSELPIGSNMYGLASGASRTGESMLFGNPHFPWEKTERLYLAHLKVGEDTEIMGAALYGLPAVLIGFNDRLAWSHTVSTAYRFTFYELTLNPADPTQYLFEGEFIDMEPREITIEILLPDGSIDTETRTLYHSHYGPMLTFEAAGVPVLNWSSARAYTLRDANAENDRMLNQFFRWNQADSFEEFVRLHGSVLGVPWVNTVATGPGRPAYYGDVTVVPNVPDAKVQACGTALSPVFAELAPGLPVLDGSREDCAWGSDADAPAEGIFGASNLPTLVRDDWVHNCNDSYWLTNPAEPLTGFAAIIGDEGTPRTLRTRKCMQQVIQRLDGSDGLPGATGFDLANLQQMVLDSSLMSEQLARQTVLDSLCVSPTLVASDGRPVQTAEACGVLAAWDGRHALESVGGHLWREFWRDIDALPTASPLKWLMPFNAEDPVNTPASLNPADPLVITAFADAIQRVEASPFDFATALREMQVSGIHDRVIPVFGGEGFEGAFTIASSRGSTFVDEGYPVRYGNSYIQTVTWDQQGQPVAEGFVTYSQATDPASPYFSDMTERYARKEWIRFPFAEADIRSDPALVKYRFNVVKP